MEVIAVLTLCNAQTKDGLQLYGTLHKANNAKKPIVIISHGYFSSNRVGPHRLYYQIANELQNVGYNVIRFDLRGIGESDGSIEEVKYVDHVMDLETILFTFRQRFNDAPVILVAHCIGCNISLPIIEKYKECLEKVIFLSPYFTTSNTIDAFFDKKQQEELFSLGYTYRKGIYADATFFSGINQFSEFVKVTKKYTELISVISAANDQFISRDDIANFYDKINQPPVIIDKADHNYLDGDARRELILTIKEIIQR